MSSTSLPFPPPSASPDKRDRLLSGLNPAQREAVLHFEGPILVLAGAGSGKTRVLTSRIAHLVEHHGVDPKHILAVTFTNKAAGEMRARVGRLLGQEPAGMWIGTFHAIGARMLRAAAPLAGLAPNFTIYDEDDALGVVKRVMEKRRISTKEWSPKSIYSAISSAKNAQTSPQLYEELARDAFSRAVAPVYRDLDPALRECNAVTFDDLLVLPVEVLKKHPHKLEEYRARFQFILVDEYQDTNTVQYEFVRLLGGEHGNVMVVGDEDQCLVAGTSVTMADGSTRPIESIRAGDEVRSGFGSGRFGAARVLRTTERPGRRQGIAIETERGRRLVSTPEHIHFAGYRLGLSPQTYFTYLMHKVGVGYRLGTTQVYTRGQVVPTMGLAQRVRHERADAAWVVSAHATENDARAEECILSLRYQIPTLPFTPRRKDAANPRARGLVHDPAYLARVFAAVDSTEGARRLLADYGLASETPHVQPRSRNSSRRNVVITLCGDRRGARPMHRISMVGNDAPGAAAIRRLGLSVRPARSGSASWRHETASVSYGELQRTVDALAQRFPLNVIRTARLGRNGEDGIVKSNSLPFVPASAVRPGMSMFDAEGGYDTVLSVERVVLDDSVYDIDVEHTHNFVANGLVTHNSVYGWRGADIRNILDFQRHFPSARVVRLEENYRSAPQILEVANVVIKANTERLGKTLRATRPPGERVTVVGALDERDEADFVAEEISARRAREHLTLRDFVILYRTNSQSRAHEEAMRKFGLPYRLVGAVRFYDRREIRDLMSYLKLIANAQDDEAFRRAIAVPRRGIGDTSVEQLASTAAEARVSLLAAAGRPDLVSGMRPAVRAALGEFAALIGRLREKAADASVDELLRDIVDSVGYANEIKKEPDAAERLDNIRELITGAAETVADEGGEVGLTPLDHFLQRATLVAERDKLDPDAEAVTMMTLHNAKGLEFPVVFVTGLEDGLFPLARAYEEPAQLEEERRLFYVGITRAERKLFLSHARSRRRNGENLPSIPSSFLKAIPPAMLEEKRTIRLRSTGFGSLPQAPSDRRPGRPVFAPSRRPAGREAAEDVGQESQDAPRFVKGERVRHARFGSGTIAELSGTGRDTKVTVDFDDESVGRKRLVVAYAGLERGFD